MITGVARLSTADDNGWLRILIADDAQAMRRSTRLMLSQIAETRVVAMAQDGREAITMTQALQPDVALVDVNMPDMDGLTAIQMMLRCQPGIICIVISVERDRSTLQRAMEVGARGYLIKPFTIEQLERTMGRAREMVCLYREKKTLMMKLQAQRDTYLRQLAQEYMLARRTDDKALAVFEQLAQDPQCELRYLKTLAVIYVFRQKWVSLAALANRLVNTPAARPAK